MYGNYCKPKRIPIIQNESLFFNGVQLKPWMKTYAGLKSWFR